MKRIDPTVKKETLNILCWTVILSLLMQAVFLLLGKWDMGVLFGNLLGGAAAVLNFFLMGLTIQTALEKEEKDARGRMKLSQSVRLLGMFLVAVVAYLLPFINTVAAIVPYLFPTVGVVLRPAFLKKKGGDGVE